VWLGLTLTAPPFQPFYTALAPNPIATRASPAAWAAGWAALLSVA
jgi:hypothetical protein